HLCPTYELPLLQEHVLGRIRRGLELAGRLAGALDHAALGVDALDGRDVGQRALGTLMFGDFELEQRDIVAALAGRAAHDLADDRAAVGILPARPRKMPADRLPVADQ